MDRVGRQGFWICAAILAILFALLWTFTSYDGVGGIGAAIVLLLRPRLNDLGRTGWWGTLPLAIGVLLVVPLVTKTVPESLVPQIEFVFGAVFLLACVVLGSLPGQPGRNRFGDPPRR